MQIYSQQDPKLRTSSLFHANIQETSQKTGSVPVIRPLAQLTQFDQIMQIYSQQDPKLRTSSLFHANIQETSQKTEERSSHLLGLA